MTLRELLLVAVGGAAGAVARHLSSLAAVEMLGEKFPWGTLFVNVLGCFLLGWLSHTVSVSTTSKLAFGTGFLGAFTTFSTFGVQTMKTWERSPLLGATNVLANVMLGLLAVLLGVYVGKLLQNQ